LKGVTEKIKNFKSYTSHFLTIHNNKLRNK